MKDTILSLVRHLLTLVGGVLAAKGIITEATWTAAAGSVTAGIGAIWGVYDEWAWSRAQSKKAASDALSAKLADIDAGIGAAQAGGKDSAL
ncbi:MAG: hypothetical protein LBC18_03075 [Opitutaceae bacterium]|jgi:hypothetical protein|nr:hypothetical protein [Opitutaceae bacterium]